MRAVRILWPAAALLSLTGIGLRLAPVPLPPANAPVIPSAQPLPAAPALESGAGIVAGNVFAVSRSAPRLRFMPRGAGQTGSPAPAPGPAPAPAPAPLTLYGITIKGPDALALIDADPRVPGAEIYRIGDRVRGSRIVAITDSTVTLAPLSGGGAAQVLRLPAGVRRHP